MPRPPMSPDERKRLLQAQKEAAFRKAVGPMREEMVPVEDGHVHRWTLDAPEGAKTWGRCRCGSRREFANSFADAPTFNT